MTMISKPIDYKYNEGALVKELQSYIDSTYGEHYSINNFQATEFIIDGGHGEGFCIGNILKYAQRYGKKEGYNRKDLMKVLHYAIIAPAGQAASLSLSLNRLSCSFFYK